MKGEEVGELVICSSPRLDVARFRPTGIGIGVMLDVRGSASAGKRGRGIRGSGSMVRVADRECWYPSGATPSPSFSERETTSNMFIMNCEVDSRAGSELADSSRNSQLTAGYASASMLAGSSDPTAIGLPRSLTVPSLDEELLLPPRLPTKSAVNASRAGGDAWSRSMKSSSTALSLSKNSSESGSKAFQ
jgi:hypothetical protein